MPEPNERPLVTALLQHAFDSIPLPDLYQFTHVPFDELLGDHQVEGRVRTSAAGLGRVALIGHSGSGKTSLVRHTLTQGNENFAAIWLQIASDPQVAAEPGIFGRHLLETLVHFAATERDILSQRDAQRHLGQAGGERYVQSGVTTARKVGGGLRTPWLVGDLGRELAEAAPDINMGVTPARVQRQLSQLFDRICGEGLLPVVVLDDTDRWLQVVSTEDSKDRLVQGFFGEVLPWLCQLRCGLVCAIHDHYLEEQAWLRARTEGVVETVVTVPRLNMASQLAQILDRRLSAANIEAGVGDLFVDDAIDALFSMYESRGAYSIRSAINLAHAATQQAVEGGAKQVVARHVAAAREDLD